MQSMKFQNNNNNNNNYDDDEDEDDDNNNEKKIKLNKLFIYLFFQQQLYDRKLFAICIYYAQLNSTQLNSYMKIL